MINAASQEQPIPVDKGKEVEESTAPSSSITTPIILLNAIDPNVVNSNDLVSGRVDKFNDNPGCGPPQGPIPK